MLALRQKIAREENRLSGANRRMFWVAALRNRQLGLWAAHSMEMELDETENYADEIVALGMQPGGELAIVDRLMEDFGRAGMDVPTEIVCLEMARRTLSAERQLRRSADLPLRAA
jgi:hypothetical protein